MHAWCVSWNKGTDNAAWLCESVIAAFISLWKLVSCIYVERNTTFRYAYHQFLVRKLQRFLVTDIILYACLVCFMEQRNRQRSMAVWECYCSFHFVVEVKVSCIYVERNTTFRYAYHFIRKYCVFHFYLTIAVGNGCHLSKVLRPWVQGTAQARRRKTLQFSKDSRVVCS